MDHCSANKLLLVLDATVLLAQGLFVCNNVLASRGYNARVL